MMLRRDRRKETGRSANSCGAEQYKIPAGRGKSRDIGSPPSRYPLRARCALAWFARVNERRSSPVTSGGRVATEGFCPLMRRACFMCYPS